MSNDSAAYQHLLRELTPQVLGVVARRVGDFAAAEDAVQEALLAAARQWGEDGVPEQPRAWLVQVALRRVVDNVRAESARRQRESIVASLVPPEDQITVLGDEASEGDDTLELFFLCCHPVLTSASAIALTLRAVGGLTTSEIARAFLVPEATMAQRISRAKQRIKESGVPFELPTSNAWRGRLHAVMHVLYLIFSEGYAASSGPDLVRLDLTSEALRITRMLRRLAPDDPEVAGLLALMILTEARRAARTGANGELIPLDEQDRGLWDRDAMAEGTSLVAEAWSKGAVGYYQLQAAISAVHDEATSTDTTDWEEILALYGVLARITDSPMVLLNQAVALAMVHGPDKGLEHLDLVADDGRLGDHYRLDAVRAHLLERAKASEQAIYHYRRAAERTASLAERNYLLLKAARLSDAQE